MDADQDRSTILADFQACTNIDDIGHALAVLEAVNWNLTAAVNQVLGGDDTNMGPGNDEEGMQGAAASVPGPSLGVVGQGMHGPPPPPDDGALPTILAHGFVGVRNDSPTRREITDEDGIVRRLIIFHTNYDNRLQEIEMMDSLTVDDLKDLIANKFNLDKSLFSVVWADDQINPEDNNTLLELHLPRENTLHIIPLPTPQPGTSNTANSQSVNSANSEEMAIRYKLNIEITLPTGAKFSNDYIEPGSKTVGEMKGTIHRLYGINIEEQIWTGWPPEGQVSDYATLAACQLTTPIHYLTVVKRRPDPNNPADRANALVNVVGGARPRTQAAPLLGTVSNPVTINSDSEPESDPEEEMMYESEEDITIIPSARRPASNNLIPANIDDPIEAVTHFNTEFVRRYGVTTHPAFYPGSLRDAVDNALQVNAFDRRLLAVYLHHDESIASNVFCSNVLCSETIVNYLSTNFLVWGWDLTLEVNKQRFYTMFEQVMGRGVDFVKRLRTDQLPVIVIVSKVRGAIEILGTSSATVSADELMTTLLQSEDVFQGQRQQDIREETERREREEMKALQDQAYEESLAQDRVKQQQKEDEEKQKLAELEAQQLEEQTQEAIRASVADTIPPEPAADTTEPVARLRFRCPNGEMINRRFLGTTHLNILLNYLVTQGYNIQEYKLLTTFPRRDLSAEDPKKTLEELKLCPQETLILEAK